jgi:multidrug efflux pump subunit AcrA (membrane-fusion protein)
MSIFSFAKRHSFIVSVITLAVIIFGIIVGRAATQKAAVSNDTGPKKVTLANASTFREGSGSVSINGTVESHSQADLKSQTSAPISVIKVAIGDNVSPGQTILELQNADIRAQLDQAKASLQLAKGQQETGAISVDSAKVSAIEKIRDAYTKTYDVIYNQIDPILFNNNSNGGRLDSYISDYKLSSEIMEIDIDLKGDLKTWKNLSDSLDPATSTQNITAVSDFSKARLDKTTRLLNDISQVLGDLGKVSNATFVSQVTSWKTTVSTAATTVSGASAALTAADLSLSSGNTAQNSTVLAQISAAQAGVNNLQAQLEKTIVKSPISGKISALPLRVGELASPGTLLATVVGGGGLQVKAFVSSDDLARIKVGMPVTLSGSVKGTVSNVAPSVSSSNKKAEVDIDVSNYQSSGLVVGQNISASIVAEEVTAPNTGSSNVSTAGSPSIYRLPIQDVKIVPGDAYVLTVDADSKIKRHSVTLGKVEGDFVEVIAGMTDDMKIVTPVYELDEGQVVSAQ